MLFLLSFIQVKQGINYSQHDVVCFSPLVIETGMYDLYWFGESSFVVDVGAVSKSRAKRKCISNSSGNKILCLTALLHRPINSTFMYIYTNIYICIWDIPCQIIQASKPPISEFYHFLPM